MSTGPSTGTPAVEMLGIQRHFPGVQALKGVDLRIARGEIHALLGENGAGKSTLMKILAGAERKDEGRILLGGEEVRISGPTDALDRGISTVYQETSLAPHLSVAENLFIGRLPAKRLGLVQWRRLYREAGAVLDRLQIKLPLRARVSELSIAQQQMTEIAKALSHDVKVLVLDEPTSALTETEVSELFRVLRDLRGHGVATVYISHTIEEILRLCDRVSILRDGELAGERAVSETSADELVRLMVGRPLLEMFPKQTVSLGDELLRVERLTVPGKAAEVSFSVRAGEVLGFAGLLGAGRTALMQTLIGAIPADGGTVLRRGEPVRIRNPQDAIRHSIGYLSDDRRRSGIAGLLGVGANLTLASLPQFSRLSVLNPIQERRSAEAVVRALRIVTPSIDQQVALLSGGNQQKTVLGRWLTAGVEVLVLDEPTRGIDVGAKVEIYRLINRFLAEGKAVILLSSHLPEVLGMSDRILVMRRGAIVAEFDRGEVTQEDVMFAATGQVPVTAHERGGMPT
ncbi:MAG TPA: sugar ABC transporter ATP-binding protein [Solirubrobacteraceae bacterium]|nr:sugar ABC transporter ATP-binding protein [Solirubrobacteraceae bacterium]